MTSCVCTYRIGHSLSCCQTAHSIPENGLAAVTWEGVDIVQGVWGCTPSRARGGTLHLRGVGRSDSCEDLAVKWPVAGGPLGGLEDRGGGGCHGVPLIHLHPPERVSVCVSVSSGVQQMAKLNPLLCFTLAVHLFSNAEHDCACRHVCSSVSLLHLAVSTKEQVRCGTDSSSQLSATKAWTTW